MLPLCSRIAVACSFLLVLSPLAFSAAIDESIPTAEVKVVGAPMGRFGFMTTYGGPFWRPTIGHLIVKDIQRGGPAEQGGMRVGDEILSVDGLAVPGNRRAEVFTAMRSKDAGASVVFKVASAKGAGPVRTLTVRPVARR